MSLRAECLVFRHAFAQDALDAIVYILQATRLTSAVYQGFPHLSLSVRLILDAHNPF